jgi:class 3 adenylate cyclase
VIGENPYYHRGPIKDIGYFFDRVRETTLSLQMVKKGQSVSVIGPRRIGKTSLLFHLSDSSVRGGNGFGLEQSLFVYIDGEMLGGLSRLDILQLMIQEIALQAGKESVIREVTDHHSFEQALRGIVKPGQQLVYLIDEFESLGKNPNLEADFFSFLRGLTVRYNLAYVTTSQVPLIALMEEGQLSSPFFNIFVPVNLGLFSDEDARQLIHRPSQEAGVGFSKDIGDFILDLAGPHPFFLQIACFHAFELSRQHPSLDEAGYRLLEEHVQADLKSHFEYFTSRLSEEELRVLARLLDAQCSESSASILQSLERKCLVHNSHGTYTFVSQAFARFIKQQIGTTWPATVAEGERRMATVLFADVVGFTPMAEQHVPEEVLSILKPALRMFVDVVDYHGGKIASFGGDSIMAIFGIPSEQPDDAARAVRAALEIQTSVVAYSQELKQNKGIDFAARVGLDTGVVVLGEIGGEQRTEYTALGDPVNLACRIQHLAEPGTVVISDCTYQQVHGRFKTEALGALHVKGKSKPVKAYRVLQEKADTSKRNVSQRPIHVRAKSR